MSLAVAAATALGADAATAATVGTVAKTAMAAGSIGATALGSVASGYATSASDKANAAIAGQNTQIAKQNATFAGQEGEQTAGIEGQKTRQTAGSLRANMGASGIDVNSGSNASVQAGQAETGQLDMMNIRARAARQAYGFNTEATGYTNQAAIDRSAGSNAIAEGYIGGATKAAGEYFALNNQGAFKGAPWKSYTIGSSINGGVGDASGGDVIT